MKRWGRKLIGGAMILAAGYLVTLRYSQDLQDSSDERIAWKRAFAPPTFIPFPKANPFTAAKYILGKKLFFDPRLSSSGKIACATCHSPNHLWSDGKALGVGHSGQVLSRRTPTLFNAAWGWSFFWDGRAATLEEQALIPIQGNKEMNMELDALTKKLNNIVEYKNLFHSAFPGETVNAITIGRAIATYERTIVSDPAPFDKWMQGNDNAISASAKRGFHLFVTTGRCVNCHTGWQFTGGSFADIGLPTQDLGKGGIIKSPDLGFTFKTPTLRNAAKKQFFMHDGSLHKLTNVIENYAMGGTVKRKTTKLFLKPFPMAASEKEDLIAFLNSLTSFESLKPGEHNEDNPNNHRHPGLIGRK